MINHFIILWLLIKSCTGQGCPTNNVGETATVNGVAGAASSNVENWSNVLMPLNLYGTANTMLETTFYFPKVFSIYENCRV